MDVNAIKEVIVKMKNGDRLLYRDKALDKLRKEMIASPAFGATTVSKRGNKIIVVDGDVEDEEQFAGMTASAPVLPVSTARTNSSPRSWEGAERTSNMVTDTLSRMAGYKVADFNYKQSDMSPMELARQMQKEAESRGISFSK